MIAIALLATGLFDHALGEMLERRFSSAEYVLMRFDDGSLVAARGIPMDHPARPGSLLKPLLATALDRRLAIYCDGGGCWRRHGSISLERAVSDSCNAFFLAAPERSLRGGLERHGIAVSQRIGPRELVGLGEAVTVAPRLLLNAYRIVLGAPANGSIRHALREASLNGTARGLKAEAFAKTGTAACVHRRRGPGDGLAMAAWPVERPRYLLLVRVHGTTGSNAAITAGGILRAIEDLR